MYKHMARLLIALLTTSLVACGGGGGGGDSSTIDIGDLTTTTDTSGTTTVATDWVTRSTGTEEHFNSIAYSGSRYVALGRAESATSDDGLHWSKLGKTGNAVIWANNLFVAVSNWSAISTSPDGINWTTRSSCSCFDELLSIAWSGSRFVAVGESGKVLTSTDGINWSEGNSGITDTLWRVAASGSRFVAVGGAVPLYSDDGMNWSASTITPAPSYYPTDVIWDGSRFLANAYGTIYASNDGTNWVQISSSAYIYNLSSNGTGYIATNGVGQILTSPDAITWTAAYNFVYQSISQLLWLEGKGEYIAVGGTLYASGIIATSPDAATWHVRLGGEHLCGVVWNGSKFLALDAVGRSFFSTDGVEWASSSMIPYGGGGVVYYQDLAWSDSLQRYVTISNDTILYSSDGITWNTGYQGNLTGFDALTWTGSQFVAVSYSGGVYASNDGIAWSAIGNIGATSIYDVAWSESLSLFIAGGSGSVYTSSDGVTWTAHPVEAGKIIYGVTWAADKFIAVGSSGAIYTSPDGVAWTAQSSGTTYSLRDVSYHGGETLAVGGAGGVLTSADGVTWTPQTTESNISSNTLFATATSPSRTVAVGELGTIISRP